MKSGCITAHYSKSMNSTLDEPVVIGGGGGQIVATSNGIEPDAEVYGEIHVRRLAPSETERLQGYSGDHTAYGAGGRKISDAQRYRQCGNSVAVPCVEWIARRIVEVDARTRNSAGE